MNFEQFSQPKKLSDLHFADPMVETQVADVANGLKNLSLILVGPCGTGKSAAAQIINDMRNNGPNATFRYSGILEGNDIKSTAEILNLMNILKTGADFPYIVINEFDQLNSSTFNSLHGLWNNYYKKCGFIFTTNHASKISEALASRMPIQHMTCPPPQKLLGKAQQYLKMKGKTYTDQAVLDVISAADNDMRHRIDAVEQLAI